MFQKEGWSFRRSLRINAVEQLQLCSTRKTGVSRLNYRDCCTSSSAAWRFLSLLLFVITRSRPFAIPTWPTTTTPSNLSPIHTYTYGKIMAENCSDSPLSRSWKMQRAFNLSKLSPTRGSPMVEYPLKVNGNTAKNQNPPPSYGKNHRKHCNKPAVPEIILIPD